MEFFRDFQFLYTIESSSTCRNFSADYKLCVCKAGLDNFLSLIAKQAGTRLLEMRCMPTRETHPARYRVIARMRDAQKKVCN